MGGGGSSGGVTPTTPPGYTGGSVVDFTPTNGMPIVGGGSSPNYLGMIGAGFSGAGKGVSGAQSAIPQTTMPQFGGATNYGDQQTAPATIPQNNMLDVLLRLLSGQ